MVGSRTTTNLNTHAMSGILFPSFSLKQYEHNDSVDSVFTHHPHAGASSETKTGASHRQSPAGK